jgi:NADH:ubiquinone reductase (H+-translocating)
MDGLLLLSKNFKNMKNDPKKIVVVGGGFAGINFIEELEDNPEFQITLVDCNNYNYFSPLLYQVATAFIEASNICYPFRKMFQSKKNLRYHFGNLLFINHERDYIETDTGILEYDFLILAVGTETNYFGLENVKKYSLPMKTVDDALNLRNHILLSFEKAVHEQNREARQKYLNIVIAGGGPSGVEVAGMLAEMRQYLAKKEYPEFTDIHAQIILVDMAPVLLTPMSKESQQEALDVLSGLGVTVKLNLSVKDYIDDKVILSNGETIITNTLIWTSGIIGRELPGLPEGVIGRGRRVQVNEYNKVGGTQNVFAIGDICLQTTDNQFPNGHPQVAQVAMQQGSRLAKNIKQIIEKEPIKPFVYNNRGNMAIISKFKAVADLPNFSFKGFFAWLVWLFIHIIPIAGFRNKVKLSLNWFWDFLTNNPSLRLIIRPREKEKAILEEIN